MKKLWLRRALVVAALAAPLPFGCRAVLGIADYELVDGGTPSDGGIELSCQGYCNAIMSQCTGDSLQYETLDVCLGYCASVPLGSKAAAGNTIGCRIGALEDMEGVDCHTAGPTGNGICGTDCDSFCASAAVVCPIEVGAVTADAGSCGAALCTPDCGKYRSSLETPNDPSLGCRVWHLAAAAQGWVPDASAYTTNQAEHCAHVIGTGGKCAITLADADVPDGDQAIAAICDPLDGGP